MGLAFLLLVRNVGTSRGAASQADARYVPNEVLVKFKEGTEDLPVKTTISSIQGNVITYLKQTVAALDWNSSTRAHLSFLDDPYLLHITVPDSIGTEKAISILRQIPCVQYAEPNVKLYFFTNDTHFSKLWGLNNTGQTGGTVDADIDAPEAWNIFTGSSEITVAVIDTGIDYNHEDLAENIWTNPGETGGGKETDGVDNDGNGYVDDWHGWDFYSGNNDPMDAYDPVYHGTHVAGTIGAKGNNNKGVVGVCWNVKLMALKTWGDIASSIPAIDYAAKMGAKGINASWGTPDYSQSLYEAIQRARAKGVLFVAAAGNYQEPITWYDNDQHAVYPASYDLDNILAVLSTDHNDALSGFSHYGKTSVDMGAPGGTGDGSVKDIYSTMRFNGYQYMAGTSRAGP